mgnify:CR=1 FL=1
MNTICKMRDIYKALSIFETAFEEVYGISLNEAMVLCALREAGKEITSTAIAERTEMAPSKVIRAVEDKGLIRRALGEVDKRQMYFSLTEAGKKRLNELDLDKVEIPEMLKPLI